jgi:hypothetical protein
MMAHALRAIPISTPDLVCLLGPSTHASFVIMNSLFDVTDILFRCLHWNERMLRNNNFARAASCVTEVEVLPDGIINAERN